MKNESEDTAVPVPQESFEKELGSIINRHSKENRSDTPDFILAEYLSGCLEVFDRAVRDRRKWYNPEKEIGLTRLSQIEKEADVYTRQFLPHVDTTGHFVGYIAGATAEHQRKEAETWNKAIDSCKERLSSYREIDRTQMIEELEQLKK